MPTYDVELTRSADKQLQRLDGQVRRRILSALVKLAVEPRPAGAIQLSGEPAGTMRIRVGDYRVVYVIDDGKLVVTVVRAGHRGQVYRDH